MRSRDPFTSWMAAYYTAQVYEFEGNIARALAYARRASELADDLRRPRAPRTPRQPARRARAARLAFRGGGRALPHGPADAAPRSPSTTLSAAIIRDNLGLLPDVHGRGRGGCRAVPRRRGDARGARAAASTSPRSTRISASGRSSRATSTTARRLGEKALALAAEYEHPTVERNTLMLLADAAMDAERRGGRRRAPRAAVGPLPGLPRHEGVHARLQRARGHQPEGVRRACDAFLIACTVPARRHGASRRRRTSWTAAACCGRATSTDDGLRPHRRASTGRSSGPSWSRSSSASTAARTRRSRWPPTSSPARSRSSGSALRGRASPRSSWQSGRTGSWERITPLTGRSRARHPDSR